MGRPKKTEEKKLEPCKKKIKKYRVTINGQHQDFPDQSEAREWARDLLFAKVFFLYLERVEVEEEGC